jgi:hypothetical protein
MTGIPMRADVRAPLAIIASSYMLALREARERNLGRKSWFYVGELHHVQARHAGRYAIISDGNGLPAAAHEALRYMIGTGWTAAGTP